MQYQVGNCNREMKIIFQKRMKMLEINNTVTKCRMPWKGSTVDSSGVKERLW